MTSMQRRMLQKLAQVSPEATMCPGRLARDCGSRLAEVREELLALARLGRVVVSQRGKPVKADDLKGPFRVRLQDASA